LRCFCPKRPSSKGSECKQSVWKEEPQVSKFECIGPTSRAGKSSVAWKLTISSNAGRLKSGE
jgi:hypothetical protein